MFMFTENISHSFSAEKVQYYTTENVTLTCIGTIDVPDFTRIYIEKVNVTLNASEKNRVQFTTSSHKNRDLQYGIYNCIINAEGLEFTKTLFLRNKGKLSCAAVK